VRIASTATSGVCGGTAASASKVAAVGATTTMPATDWSRRRSIASTTEARSTDLRLATLTA
jgi:hypothetical protein